MRLFGGTGIVAAALATIVGSAAGTTLEVPQEYPTITAALAAAGVGDTVLVDDGIYFETARIEPGRTVISRNLHGADIRGNGGNAVVFVGSGQTSDAPATISRVLVQSATSWGPAVIQSENPNTLVEDCLVLGGGPIENVLPVVWLESGGIVRRCHVDGLRQSTMFQSTDPGAYMLIEDCLLGEFVFGIGIQAFGDSSYTEFRNNTVDRAYSFLCSSFSRPYQVHFVNNIFWHHNLQCYGFGEYISPELLLSYNCFEPLDLWDPFYNCPEYIRGPGNIEGDPAFCDDPGRQWWLDPDSPCIGTGENGEDMGV
ncbi:MAG: hypothetical protein KC729_15030, partial [Candidatus Eisenbacteria bacterium]|nr:hypothetical protein [Candidatus Eisenbacteria bacterium]